MGAMPDKLVDALRLLFAGPSLDNAYSDDDDYEGSIFVGVGSTVGVKTRSGLAMLVGTDEEAVKVYFQCENIQIQGWADRAVPGLLRYAKMIIFDAGVDTLAFVQFTKYLGDGPDSILNHPDILAKLPAVPADATPDDKREACSELLKILEARTKSAFQPSTLNAQKKYTDFVGADVVTGKLMASPQIVCDRMQLLFNNWKNMEGSLVGPEHGAVIRLIKMTDVIFKRKGAAGLGTQVLERLCKTGVYVNGVHTTYKVSDLTIAVFNAQATHI
jgi:hypothetical protein